MGYIAQAAVNNFIPLLFVFFNDFFDIPLSKITLLITVNFAVQLIVDLLSAGFADKIGYKKTMTLANALCALGMICLVVLPYVTDEYAGILISVVIYAVGGGLLEVVVSPTVEACPTERKKGTMGLLHSFYCWGQAGVVLLSTLFFAAFGMDKWYFAAVLWALLPIANIIYLIGTPFPPVIAEDDRAGIKELLGRKMFWLMFAFMLCAGAAEQSMSQWASAFAETGIGVQKSMGDIFGTCMFAVLMGSSRLIYSALSAKISLKTMMLVSAVLCIASYITAGLSQVPVMSLIGCALCGFSVGIMWPGTFSISANRIPAGGTAMFAFLALAGDVGCGIGPTLVGFVSDGAGGDLKAGLLAAVIFPLVLFAGIAVLKKSSGKQR